MTKHNQKIQIALLSTEKKARKRVFVVLSLILLLQLIGFFTLTENIAITRVVKVLLRIGSLLWIILFYNKIVNNYLIVQLLTNANWNCKVVFIIKVNC